MRPIITLTTDFGVSSPYVAQMKGMILSICPTADIVDITHAIEPQNIAQGAIVLDDVLPFFPAATIHVAVIDPGVGTTRKLLYLEIGDCKVLAPNNGLCTALWERAVSQRAITLSNNHFWANHVSSTFHGRDIFAPVAAYLALGLDPTQLGSPVDFPLVKIALPRAHVARDHAVGAVLLADSFGNLITNLQQEELRSLGASGNLMVACKGLEIAGIRKTYGEASPGEMIALFDSQGRLEIAMVNGNAQQHLQAATGTEVVVRISTDSTQ